MALTDGYVTDDPAGDWEYANTGGTGRGDVTSPLGNAWIRVQKSGPIPGTQVKEDGSVQAGPSVSFTTPDGVLSGAAEAEGDRPWIIWAGVSPMSLSEVLIVWNKPVVLLNKQGIVGGEAVSLTGRLMILRLDGPISIGGKEQRQIQIQPGSVGFYRDLDGPSCDEEPEDTVAGAGGNIPDPDDYTEGCGDCVTVQQGTAGAGDPGQGGDPAQVTARVFCDMCNPDAQCGDFEGDTAAFVVNNGLDFPVRCCHPFALVNVFNCDCPPEPCPPVPAPVWQVCMDVFGTTEPMDTLPLDQLFTINPCNAALTTWSNGYPAILQNDVDCCGTASVQILGRYGTTATDSGGWLGPLPGYRGQQVLFIPDCSSFCDEECVSIVKADWEDEYVAEDIIKPSQRSIPISFFDSWFVTETSYSLPTAITTTVLDVVTECLSIPLNLITEIQTTVVEFPTSIVTAQISIPGDLTPQVETINSPVTAVRDVVVDAQGTNQSVLVDKQVANLSYVQSVATVDTPVVADVTYKDLKVVQSVDKVDSGPDAAYQVPVDGEVMGATWFGDLSAVYGRYLVNNDIQDSATFVTECLKATQNVLVDAGTPVTATVANGPVEQISYPQIQTQEVVVPTDFGTQVVTAISGQGAMVQGFDVLNLNLPTALTHQTVTNFDPDGGDILGLTSIADGVVTQITAQGDRAFYAFDQVVTAAEVGAPVTAITDISLGSTPIGVFPVGGGAVTSVDYNSLQGVSDFSQNTATAASAAPLGAGWVTAIGTTQVVLCDAGGAEVTVTVVTDVQTAAAGNVVIPYVEDLNLEVRDYAEFIHVASPMVVDVFDTLSTGSAEFVGAQAGPTAVPVTALTSLGTATQSVVQTLEWYPVGLTTQTFLEGANAQSVDVVANLTTQEVQEVPVTEVTALEGQLVGVVTSMNSVTTNWAFSAEPTQEVVTLPGDVSSANLTYVNDCQGAEVFVGTQLIALFATPTSGNLVKADSLETVQSLVQEVVTAVEQVVTAPVIGGVKGVQSVVTDNQQVVVDAVTGQVTEYPPTAGQITEVESVNASTFTIFEAGSLTTLNLPVEIQNDQLTAVKDFVQANVNVVTECLTSHPELKLPDGELEDVTFLKSSDTGIMLLTSTTPGCDVPFKFMNHPGPDTYTVRISNNPGCCDGAPTCVTQEVVLPWETSCETIVLLHGHYVQTVPLGNAEECPCYDCTDDGPQITGDDTTPADVGEPGGGLNPCTTRIQRVNRRFCKECLPSGG